MKKFIFPIALLLASCHHSPPAESLSLIQIQDRNGLTETISNPDRLNQYQTVDFLSAQPYKKVLRVFKSEGKNQSKITTYYPNGIVCQYLEGEEMRAHGTYKEWYINGQIKIEARLVGGNSDVTPEAQQTWLFDGVSLVYNEQGNIAAQIPYTKGQLDGISTYFYPSGQIKSEIPFRQNEMEGDLVEYLENGTLKSKSRYKKGMKEGESVSFFEDGTIASVEDYSEGYLRGGKYYNRQGEKISEIQNGGGYQALFEGRELTLIEFHVGQPDGLIRKYGSNGEMVKSIHIKNGKKHGEEIDYYPPRESEEKTIPKLSVMWNENMIHGAVKTWYSHGQLQSQRDYSRNQLSGSALAWYPNGALMLFEEYEEERLLSGRYYKLNKADPVSTISNGNGIAILFDESGALSKKIKYFKGKPVDPED